jgi:hypothetical protein
MAEQLMTLAYDNGINLFDTAEVYAAGKYVHFSRVKVAQDAREEPESPGIPVTLFPRVFTVSTLPSF